MTYYLTAKKKSVGKYSGKLMEPKTIMQREITQISKGKYDTICPICTLIFKL